MILLKITVEEKEWDGIPFIREDSEHGTKLCIFDDREFFIEPDSTNPNQVLIQFGRGHVKVSKTQLLKAMFEYQLMDHNIETFIQYKEDSLLKKFTNHN